MKTFFILITVLLLVGCASTKTKNIIKVPVKKNIQTKTIKYYKEKLAYLQKELNQERKELIKNQVSKYTLWLDPKTNKYRIKDSNLRKLKEYKKQIGYDIKFPPTPKNVKEYKKQIVECKKEYKRLQPFITACIKTKYSFVSKESPPSWWKRPKRKKQETPAYVTAYLINNSQNSHDYSHAWANSESSKNEEIENLKKKISYLEKMNASQNNVLYDHTPIPESATTKAFFAKPAEKTSSWSSKPYNPYPGMVRISPTIYMKPNAYGPGVGMDQYGRPVKTVPAFK